MVQQITDIRLLVRDVLREQWDNSELVTPLTDDDIHTGWYDDGKGYPQVTVTNPEEGVLDGGDTGVTGINGSGDGYVQHRNGTVLVNCWAGSRADYDAEGEAQLQSEEMANVVDGIIFDNIHALSGVDSITVTNRTRLVDTDENPSEYRVQLELTFNWTKD